MIAVLSALKRHKSLTLTGLLVLWCVAAIATHVPASSGGTLAVSDKVLHVAGYLGLSMAWCATLHAFGLAGMRQVAWVALVMGAYGVVDELTQPPFGRDASIFDWLADVVGVAMAIGLWNVLVRKATGSRESD